MSRSVKSPILDYAHFIPFYSSNKVKQIYEVNVRLVYGCHAIGKGCEAAKTICGIMNFPSPPTKFLPYTELLGSATDDVCF